MEPSYSVLIFSKYSPNCKKLFDMVSSSGIDFDRTIGNKLQLLCIDNEQVRKRIKANGQIDVTTVPCILSIFANGGVEKYDGGHAFAWVENLIVKFAPPPPPPPQRSLPPPPQPQQKLPPQEVDPELQPESEPESYAEPEPPKRQPQKSKQQKRQVKVPARMKQIRQEEEVEATPIGDIPLEDEDNDRHRNIPPPRRIRQDEGKYIEDENLFSGEPTDMRRGPTTGVRSTAVDRKNSPDPHGLRAKAEELARGRDNMDMEFGTSGRRSISDRRP
jgi:hypothetical protein